MPALTIIFISIALIATTYLDRFSRAKYTFPATMNLTASGTITSRSHKGSNLKILNCPHPITKFVTTSRLLLVSLWRKRNSVHGRMMWSG